MKLSKCYQSSDGQLSCLTCHDPHEQPRSEAASYYRARCLGCHTEKNCSLPLPLRNQKSPPDDCAGCHMPKRSLTLISHSVLTDHRIVTGENEPYPEAAFHQTTPELPDLVHVNAIPGARNGVSPLTLLQAYGELAASHPEYREHYLVLLRQLSQSEPDNPLVLSAQAQQSLDEGTPAGREAAIRYWSKAIQLGSSLAGDYENLGRLLADAGRASEAITIVELGIKLDPYDERLYQRLAQLDIATGRYPQALAVMRKDLELFPQDDFMRSLVKKAEQAELPSAGLAPNR